MDALRSLPSRPNLNNNVREVENRQRQPEEKKKQKFMVSGVVPFELDIKYAPMAVLGNGAYGIVCSCFNRETNEMVAVKKIPDALCNETTALGTLREIQILRRIGKEGGHNNVITLKDVMLSSSSSSLRSNFRHVYLVQDLMDADLSQVIKNAHPRLSPNHVKVFMYQILRGLDFLHSKNVIHRDLKPQNILVNNSNLVKISDFGLARTKIEDPQKMTEYMVTRWYRAPELLTGAAWYGNGVDMWSAGCVLAEMLGGTPVFQAPNSLAQIIRIYSVLGKKPGELSHLEECCKFKEYLERFPSSPGLNMEKLFPWAESQAVDLLKNLLVVDPWDRLSASQALRHPYFKGIYDPDRDSCGINKGISLEVDEFCVDEKMIRELIWEEMLYYHPEERTVNDL